MAGAKIIVHDKEVLARLARMKELPRRAMLREIGSYAVSSTIARFRAGEAPDGSKWQPLAYTTKLARIGGSKAFKKRGGLTAAGRRRLGGLKPLIDRANLMRSITYAESGDRVSIGTNMIYGAIHQFGGDAGRGRRAKIPARPYLGFSRTDRLEIAGIVRRYVQGVVG